MPAWSRIGLATLGCLAASAAWSVAQDGKPTDESRIRVILSGAKPVRDDLKEVMQLAPGTLKKQAQNVDETLESFQQGVEPTKPIGFDIVFGPTETLYQPNIPVAKLDGRDGFIANLKDFGFKIAGPDATGLYTITEPPPAVGSKKAAPKSTNKAAPAAPAKTYYMRYAHGHALISPRKSDLPANLPDPSKGLQAALNGRDVALRIDNDAATLQKRRDTFQEFRKQLEAAIKFKRGESEADFELRKLSATQSFNEAARFLIESQVLDVGWTTDAAKKSGSGVFRLEATPGTSLAASVQLLVQQPSYFANVKLHDKPVVALRANFAIDDLRSQHAQELYKAIPPTLLQRIDTRPTLTAEGKKTAKEAIGGLFEILEASRAIHVLDCFIDLHAASEKNTLVCGIRCVNGAKAVDLIEALPKVREGWKVAKDVAEEGAVKIHAVTVAPHRLEEFQSVFAGEPVVYLGTSNDAVWGAAGLNGLDELKAAIKAAGKPAPEKADPEFFSLRANFGPLVDLLRIVREKSPKEKIDENDKDAQAEAEQLEKTRAKWNKFAKDAFALCDVGLEASLRRQGDAVTGTMSVHECVLQFVGSVIANWAAENLE